MLILNTRNTYSKKVEFVGSALINVACLFRHFCVCVFYFVKYRLTYKSSSEKQHTSLLPALIFQCFHRVTNPVEQTLVLKMIHVTLWSLTTYIYRVILSVLDPRKCEYFKDYSLDFQHAYMTTYLAS